MTIQHLSLNNYLSIYLLEDESILFSSLTSRLFGLDRSATYLLLRLADGEAVEDLAATLRLGTAEVAAAEELSSLLAGREPAAEEYRIEKYCPDAVPQDVATLPCYRLLTTSFTLDCPDPSLHSFLSAGLRHLLLPQRTDLDLAIVVEPEGSQWRLRLNGTAQGNAVPVEWLMPAIYGRLRIIAYQRFPYLLAMHAAVVGDGRRTIVLPGRSGSGKSTLAATLLARGYRLFSDEIALLAQDGGLVPIPLGLGLKEGSWPLLEGDYPALAATPVHRRWDGVMVRYLEPGSLVFAEGDDGRRVTHLCFPHFQPDSPGGLERLSPVNALRRLTETGYQVSGLTVENVDRIVAWICGLSCFSLSYSSTEKALRMLDSAVNDHVQ